jgi:hypothetical protein
MRGTSPILVTAALSISGLVVAIGMYFGNLSAGTRSAIAAAPLEPVEPRISLAIEDKDGNGTPDWQDELLAGGVAAATSTESETADPIEDIEDDVAGALYGGYLSLKQQGSYTPQQGNALAYSIASNIRAPLLGEPLTDSSITTRENSRASTLAYRAESRDALAPIVTDDPPEIEYYAYYVSTKDASWLSKLSEAASQYREARENMLAVVTPEDAVQEHLRALNALGAYAETLDRLANVAPNAFAAAALLKTMNEAEEEMLAAFDALAQYYVHSIAQQ